MKDEYKTKLSLFVSKLPTERKPKEVVNRLPDTMVMKRKNTEVS